MLKKPNLGKTSLFFIVFLLCLSIVSQYVAPVKAAEPITMDGYGYDWTQSMCKGVDWNDDWVHQLNDGYDGSRDIIAAYYVEGTDYVFFRIDFLDLAYGAENGYLNIYIAIDYASGGQEWFPDYTDCKTSYLWERCIAIYDTNNYKVYNPDWSYVSTGLTINYHSQNDLVEIKVPQSTLGFSNGATLNIQYATVKDGAELSNPDADFTDIYPNDDLSDGVFNTAVVSTSVCSTAKVVFLHHGNQAINNVTDWVNKYNNTLNTHEDIWNKGVAAPVELHVSGSLMTAIQWYKPSFNTRIKNMVASGHAKLVAGSYVEYIPPFFDYTINNLSMVWAKDLTNYFYGASPNIAWIPERVWQGSTCLNVFAQNYNGIVLDGNTHHDDYCSCGASHQVHTYANKPNLHVWFICWQMQQNLRQPDDGGLDIGLRKHMVGLALASNQQQYCLYAEDWEFGASDAANYDIAVKWIAQRPWIQITTLNTIQNDWQWPAQITNYACTQDMYWYIKQWCEPNQWYGDWYYGSAYEQSYFDWVATETLKKMGDISTAGTHIYEAYNAIKSVPSNNFKTLAWYTFFNMLYETAWHDDDGNPATVDPVSLWERKFAAHVRMTKVLTYAASWLNALPTSIQVETTDVDGDGSNEYALKNNKLLAIFEAKGGKCIWAFSSSGKMILGSPIAQYENLEDAVDDYYHCASFRDKIGGVDYSNTMFTVTTTSTSIKFTVSAYSKTFTLESATATRIKASYSITTSKTRYLTFGISPDLMDIIKTGQSNLAEYKGTGYYGWQNTATGAKGYVQYSTINIAASGSNVPVKWFQINLGTGTSFTIYLNIL